MDRLTKTQIIWTETKDLTVPDGGNDATLSKLRLHIAAIVDDAGDAFARFEPIPARDDSLYGRDVLDCATAADAPVAAELKNLQVILWPSADGKTLNKDDVIPPAPWSTANPASLELIGRFMANSQDVSAFARVVSPGDTGPRFVSLVSGTGLPPNTSVYVPRATGRKAVDSKVANTAFWLAMASLALFVVACLWCLSVGSMTRATSTAFVASGADQAACPTSIDLKNASALFSAPQAWLPTSTGPSECQRKWQAAQNAVLGSTDRDWWEKIETGLARLTRSDTGTFSLRIPTLTMMLTIVLLTVAAGLGVLGRPLGLFIDKRNRMSLTRVQFAVWLVVLMGGLASYSLFNVGFWGGELNRIQAVMKQAADASNIDQGMDKWTKRLGGLLENLPAMDGALWGLIGISGGSAVLSSFLTRPGTPSSPNQPGRNLPTRRTRILTNDDSDEAQLSDLVYGETEENDGVVDSTRVQTIAITGILVAVYANLILEASERLGGVTATDAVNSGTQVFASMPPVSATFLWLLGISHATLLGGKLLSAYWK